MKKIMVLAAAVLFAFSLAGCSLDVVGNDALRAYNEIAQSGYNTDKANFEWNGELGGAANFTFDIEPFTAAGLNDVNAVNADINLVVERENIGYHTAMDHYNIDLGDGNLFEWAKDVQTNGTTGENQDKDVVFVLNPEPFIAAGVDPNNVDGWAYAQVSVDINGTPTDIWKFLRPFDIR
ncbi:MAG: hypothetical protein LBL34_04470 [Clostridiales bacterium]|jgi:hypothetical protein|nr:hypothetical protein [Clostridiales bacterium]